MVCCFWVVLQTMEGVLHNQLRLLHSLELRTPMHNPLVLRIAIVAAGSRLVGCRHLVKEHKGWQLVSALIVWMNS